MIKARAEGVRDGNPSARQAGWQAEAGWEGEAGWGPCRQIQTRDHPGAGLGA